MAYVLTSTENLSHEDWLECRNLGIGGSDASVVCGINKWKSPVELYMEKLKLSPPTDAGEAAYWGTRLEDLVKEEFTMRTGIEVIPVNAILQHEEYPFMFANLDGICEHPEYGNVVFEAKTSGFYRNGEWEGDKIPDEYVLQIQHYMAVTGFRGAYIAVLLGGNNFKWKFVERDEELISMLIQLEAEFWERIQSEMPPELDGSDASTDFLKQHFPDSISTNIELPEEADNLIVQYDSACEAIDEFTILKQQAENLLKQMLGEHEGGRIGDRLITWKTVQQERLDSKAIKTDHPTLCKKYSNTTSYRRFSVKAAS
jgi:putative phage-type endonuclease